MQYHWLNKKNNKNLIIFFGGWSFDYCPFQNIPCENNDVIMIYDYNNLNIDFDFGKYEKYYLISWSMGVFIGYLLRDKLPEFSKKIAVNGTPYPINNEWGIPNRTFDLTIKYVETGLSGKFYQNIFSDTYGYERYTKSPVKRSMKDRCSELFALDKLIKNTKLNYELFYDLALISDFDKIIPPKNQHNFWDNKVKVKTIESGHFPFYNYKSWGDLINAD